MKIKRNTLKKLAGIGIIATTLPSTWLKPVVSSVVLPAHAETSNVHDECEILAYSAIATANPSNGVVQLGDKITIQVNYSIDVDASTNISLIMGSTSLGSNNGTISLAGDVFTGVTPSGSQTIEAEVLSIQADSVFTELSVDFSIRAMTTSGLECLGGGGLTTPVNLTGS